MVTAPWTPHHHCEKGNARFPTSEGRLSSSIQSNICYCQIQHQESSERDCKTYCMFKMWNDINHETTLKNILAVEPHFFKMPSLQLEVRSEILICKPINLLSKPNIRTSRFWEERLSRTQFARRHLQSKVRFHLSDAATHADTSLPGVERVVWMSGGHRWPPPSRQRPAWATLSGRSRSYVGLVASRQETRCSENACNPLSCIQLTWDHASEQRSTSPFWIKKPVVTLSHLDNHADVMWRWTTEGGSSCSVRQCWPANVS